MKSKINCCKILSIIAKNLKVVNELLIGFFNMEIIGALQYASKDRVHKVQIAGNEAFKEWLELERIYNGNEQRKMIYKDMDMDKNQLIDYVTNEENDIAESGGMKGMNKFNMLRNLSKMNKLKEDPDTPSQTNHPVPVEERRRSYSPDIMKEEIYKKGISNVLKGSSFKNRDSSHQLRERKVSPQNIVKESIKNYIKGPQGTKLETSTNFDYKPIPKDELMRPVSSKNFNVNETRQSIQTL